MDLEKFMRAETAAVLPMPADFASVMHERVEATLKEFQNKIAADEEIAVCLAQFGREVTISVESVGFRNPHLLSFFGCTSDGTRCELVQHVSQVNLLLMAVKVAGREPRRIGFGHSAEAAAK